MQEVQLRQSMQALGRPAHSQCSRCVMAKLTAVLCSLKLDVSPLCSRHGLLHAQHGSVQVLYRLT